MQLKKIGNLQNVINAFNNSSSSGVKFFNSLDKATQNYILTSGKLSKSQLKAIENNIEWTITSTGAKVATSGLTAEELKQAVANDTLSISQTTTTTTTTGLTTAFKGLWATLKANPIILIATVATIGITILDKYKNHLEEVRQATEQSATVYKESASSIDDYVSRYQDLQKALQEAKGNEEQTATVKQQLLDLQTELNSKFGEEAKAINLVTGEYEKQIEVIRSLNKEEANKFLNENRKGIATATKKMEKDKTYSLSYGTVSAYTDEGKALQDIASSYADKGMVVNTDEATGIMTITLKADAQTAYDTINDFETDLRNKAKDLGNEKLFDSVFTVSSDALNNAKSVVDKYGEIYNQALMAELVTDDDLSATYNEALNAVEDYNEALVTGENVAEAKKNLDDVKAKIEGNSETWGKYASITEDLFAQAGADISQYSDTVTDTMGKVEEATKFTKTQMIDTINSMADGFDVLDDIYADVLDGGTFDFTKLDTSKFSEAFSEITPEYEKFIETVSASPTDIKACQGAFNDLVSAFIDSKGILEGVDEETKQLTIDMLENMGVINAEEVVMSTINAKLNEYANAKSVCASAGIDLTNATRLEILELMREQEMSEETRISLWRYQMQKALSNENGINTVYDCVQLENLARASGYTGSALLYLAKIKSLLNKIDNENIAEGTLPYRMIEMQIKQCNSSLQQLLSTEVATTKATVNYGGASKTAAATQDKLKDSTKKTTDALEKQKEVLNEQKSELEALHGAIIDYIDDEIEEIEDKTSAIEKQNDKLKDQLDVYDDIISAVTNNIDIEIDAIDDKIDKLRDANDEEERGIALEEAKRKLLEARSRKTKLVYTKNAGFTYQTDSKAISEATSELESLQQEELINSLEKEKELLEENKQKWLEIADAREKALQAASAAKYFGNNWRDTTLNPSDKMIGKLQGDYVGTQIKIEQNDSRIEELNKEKEFWENEKKLWQDALDEYEKQQNRARLESFFGSDYEHQLLNNSAVWRRKFADEYSSVCSEIEALEERIKASSETTTSTIESGANRIADSANKVREATKDVKFEINHEALEEAELKLKRLDFQIASGQQGLETARNAVANFIKEYEAADGCTTITEGLANSVKELDEIYGNTGDSMAGMISGINTDITDFETKSRTLSENLTEVDIQMQSIASSEAQVEENVNSELSNTEQTISNLLTKLGELKTNLSEIIASRIEVETIADEELLDTSTVVDGVHTKVGEIQSAITLLLESITPLEGALDTLMQKLTTLDEVTLSNVIGAFGGASGGEGGDSKESGSKSQPKGSEGNKDESGGGSGFLGAVKAVDEAIGSTENPESLLGKLQNLDDKTLEKIIAQFGLGGESGESEGENLLSAVNAVSQAIVGGKDDDTSLIANIEKLGSDPTIENITTVSDSFQTLHDTIDECVKKVEELSKAIESIPSSTATVGINGGKSSGRAKGGIITKEDEGDLDFVAKSLGEDHMVALTEGEAVIPKENVAKNPEVVQSLIDGDDVSNNLTVDDLAKKYGIILDYTDIPISEWGKYSAVREGVEIKRPEWTIADGMKNFSLNDALYNIPNDVVASLNRIQPIINNNQQQTTVQINGDLSFPNIKSGNDAELLIKDISNMANKARQRSARRY